MEGLRTEIRDSFQQRKPRFLLSLKSEKPLTEHLEQYKEKLLSMKKKG